MDNVANTIYDRYDIKHDINIKDSMVLVNFPLYLSIEKQTT